MDAGGLLSSFSFFAAATVTATTIPAATASAVAVTTTAARREPLRAFRSKATGGYWALWLGTLTFLLYTSSAEGSPFGHFVLRRLRVLGFVARYPSFISQDTKKASDKMSDAYSLLYLLYEAALIEEQLSDCERTA